MFQPYQYPHFRTKWKFKLPFALQNPILSTRFLLLPCRLFVKCVIKGINHDQQELKRSVTSSDCHTVSLGLFQDGYSYWTPTQGLYTLTMSVHDSSPYALYSHAYSLAVVNPTSLQLQTNKVLSDFITIDSSSIQAHGVELVYPSSLQPVATRWFVDEKEVSATL